MIAGSALFPPAKTRILSAQVSRNDAKCKTEFFRLHINADTYIAINKG